MPRVCVVGSSTIDLTFRAPRLPRAGETLPGLSFRLGFGGRGANQAVMAARLGATVTLVTRVGRDLFGEETVRHYQQEGIDTTHVRFDAERPSGVASTVVDDDARTSTLVVAGANDALSPQDVQDAAGAIRAADVLLCQLEVPLATTLEALRLAKAAGVRTLLKPAPARPMPDELLRLADLCVVNEAELEQLTGLPAWQREDTEEAAGLLLQRGPGAVIVTRGERGVLAVGARAGEFFAAVPVAAVNPRGAGDVFSASLAVFLAEGRPLADAVCRAQAVAALSVTRTGGQTALPSRSEVAALLLTSQPVDSLRGCGVMPLAP
jgi:ribokinase